MKILELGAEGGSITIEKHAEKYLVLTQEEVYDEAYSSTARYDTLQSAWRGLTDTYRFWPHFFPLYVSPEIAPLIRKAVSKQADLNEF